MIMEWSGSYGEHGGALATVSASSLQVGRFPLHDQFPQPTDGVGALTGKLYRTLEPPCRSPLKYLEALEGDFGVPDPFSLNSVDALAHLVRIRGCTLHSTFPTEDGGAAARFNLDGGRSLAVHIERDGEFFAILSCGDGHPKTYDLATVTDPEIAVLAVEKLVAKLVS